MQRQSETSSTNADGERMLDPRAMLLHNRHVQAGRTRDKARCGFCSKGLDGVAPIIEIPDQEPEHSLVEGDRGDEERPASSAPTSREYWE